jgi:hypothetical protein
LDGYVRGHRDYRFSAKVYSRASDYGIESGRVSKLTVWHGDKEIIGYDRGFWEIRPSEPEHERVLSKIIAAFPQPTKQQYRGFRRIQRDHTRSRQRKRDFEHER